MVFFHDKFEHASWLSYTSIITIKLIEIVVYCFYPLLTTQAYISVLYFLAHSTIWSSKRCIFGKMVDCAKNFLYCAVHVFMFISVSIEKFKKINKKIIYFDCHCVWTAISQNYNNSALH